MDTVNINGYSFVCINCLGIELVRLDQIPDDKDRHVALRNLMGVLRGAQIETDNNALNSLIDMKKPDHEHN